MDRATHHVWTTSSAERKRSPSSEDYICPLQKTTFALFRRLHLPSSEDYICPLQKTTFALFRRLHLPSSEDYGIVPNNATPYHDYMQMAILMTHTHRYAPLLTGSVHDRSNGTHTYAPLLTGSVHDRSNGTHTHVCTSPDR